MTQDKEFLGTEPVGRLLWRLAVPTVIAQLVNMLYNIVDRIYIGHIPGDGSARRVRQTFRLLLKVCLGYALVLWACIQLFPGAFARIFTPEPELVAFTAGMLRIYCGALFLMGIQIACQMTFVSIGNAPCSIVVAVLRKFVLLLPLIYLLPHLLADQTRAVFLAEPVADTIAVTGTVLLFSFQFRKALRKLESENKT